MKARQTYASAAFRVPANRANEAGGMPISDQALGCAVADLVRGQSGIGDFAEPFELGMAAVNHPNWLGPLCPRRKT
jgi:hypothetical protein